MHRVLLEMLALSTVASQYPGQKSLACKARDDIVWPFVEVFHPLSEGETWGQEEESFYAGKWGEVVEEEWSKEKLSGYDMEKGCIEGQRDGHRGT